MLRTLFPCFNDDEMKKIISVLYLIIFSLTVSGQEALKSLIMRMALLKMLQLVVLCAIFSAGCAYFAERSFTGLMTKGQNAYTGRDYTAAEDAFRKALQLAEKEWSADQVVEVLGDLGRTYDEEGKLEQAESAFKRRIAMADSEHLGAEMRIETRLAIAIFYSKHERCDELKSTLDSLNNSSDPEIRSSKGYQETIGLIADMSTLRCSGRN